MFLHLIATYIFISLLPIKRYWVPQPKSGEKKLQIFQASTERCSWSSRSLLADGFGQVVKWSSEIQVMNQSNSVSDSSGFLSTIKIKFIDHTTKKMLSTRRKIGCNMRLKSASLLLPVDVQSRGRENLWRTSHQICVIRTCNVQWKMKEHWD